MTPAARLDSFSLEIVCRLKQGPVQSFGSSRDFDAALQRMKRAGAIVHRRKNAGGNGWQFTHKGRAFYCGKGTAR